MKTTLSFVTLHTTDYPAALAFFTDILGFEQTETRPGATAFVAAGGAGLALRAHGGLTPPLGVGVTVYFTVPDVQAFHDEVVARGAVISEPLHDMPFGRTFTVQAPDGQGLGFWQEPA
ncbi:putative enzyme related to lactoylglutathione lyase [Deinococcus metalli]|uniref:Glyoxalase n=1 Tax=Deinococcus metalli TaxID=1141878 RepID=A0A7W8NSV0_9DEIO|nr:VOC family protein [Deinococcus metalli]MBB5378363.1 putative enzyme related to lactoylglutathione lyase [Deinococcus metalli]GHF59445.1 glyoxalase [Deinococcus metalli]